MKRTMLLALVMIKGNGFATFGSDSRRRKSRLGSTGNLLLFAFVFLYMGVMTAVSSRGLYSLLQPLQLQSLIPVLFLTGAVTLSFFFGAIYVISVFYYSSDVEKLLPLPLQSGQIISAKLIVTASYIEMMLLMLLMPGLVMYGYLEQLSFVYYIYLLIIVLVLPLIPLCMAAILVMLLMRLTPFARNKDRFNTISGLLVLGITMVIVLVMPNLSGQSGLDFAAFLESGTTAASKVVRTVVPGTAQAVSLLVDGEFNPVSMANLGLLLLFALAAWLLMLVVGRAFYFKGVIGLSSSASKRRRLSSEDLLKAGRSGSAFISLMAKDLRILFRTPIFLMNNVIMNFIWPVFLIIPLFSTQSEPSFSLTQLRAVSESVSFQDNQVIAIVLCVVFGLSGFVTSSNGISASALSREGKLLYIMKIIPMPYSTQILAKISAGGLLGLAGSLLTIILAIIFFLPPWWLILLALLILPGAVMLPSLAGIIFDLLWPKLQWDNEQKAVKQNLNVLYAMLSSLILLAVCAVPAYLLAFNWLLSLAVLIGLPWLLNAGLYLLVRAMSSKYLLSIDA